jgi:hypothetical protein
MRSFLTSLFALIVSLFIGILIAQALAVWSNGSEEWLVAFGLAMLVAGAVTVVFFIEQLAFGTRKAAYVTALILTAIFALVAGMLVWASITLSTGPADAARDGPLIAGIVLPGLAIILIQWLIVRWRVPQSAEMPVQPRFGRGGQLN